MSRRTMEYALKRPATSRALKDIDIEEYFVYAGQEGEIVPRDVTSVKVHPTVKVIKARAFYRCSLKTVILNDDQGESYGLITVTLHDGLEEIGEKAFCKCTSLQGIVVPPTVNVIKARAFYY